MVERIRTLLEERQLTPTQFADLIGVGRPIISHILSGRNKPSLEVVQRIIAAFPDLALPWLLSGAGPMLAASATAVPVEPTKTAKKQVASSPVTVHQPTPAVATPRTPEPKPLPIASVPASTPVASEPAMPVVSPEVATSTPSVPPIPPVATPAAPAAPAASAADVALATALAEPNKVIRRIVFFYQDGTFSAFQPE